MTTSYRFSSLSLLASTLLVLAACGDDHVPAPSAAPDTSAAAGGSGGNGTGGTAAACEPGETRSCYSGPEETEGVGQCQAGEEICGNDGTWVEGCQGEVLPGDESCLTPSDEDCDGDTNEGGEGCVCTPEFDATPCYNGAVGTENVGNCIGGLAQCNADGTDYADTCLGEVTPAAENCQVLGDEDCNGVGCADPQWAKLFGNSGEQRVTGVAVDSGGNIVLAGYFDGTIDFGGGPLTAVGDYDVFVVKLSATGAHVWSQRFGESSDSLATGVAIGPNDTIALTGHFAGTIDFGDGDPLDASDVDGEPAGFVAELYSTGEYKEQLLITDCSGGSCAVPASGSFRPSSIAYLSNGLLAVGGQYAGTFGCFFSSKCPPMAANDDGFVTVYNANFSLLFLGTALFAGAGSNGINAVSAIGTNEIVAVGRMSGAITVDDNDNNVTDGTAVPAAGASLDIVVARLQMDADVIWADSLGGTGADEAYDVVGTSAGDAWIVGRVGSQIDLGLGAIGKASVQSALLAHLNNAGAPVFGSAFGEPSSGGKNFTSVALDASGQVLVGGIATGDIDLGGGVLPTGGQTNLLLAKYSSAGAHLWSKALASTSSAKTEAVAVSGNDAIAAGYVGGDIDFGLGALTSGGGLDVFLARFHP